MFNLLKTAILMAVITALFILVGASIGGGPGLLIALVMAAGMNFYAYWFSDQMVLKMVGASLVDPQVHAQYYQIVQALVQKAGMPMPAVYIIEENAPNAFATGRNPSHAAVVATTGILRILTASELRGVIAHELSHIQHRDILISTISATMAGAIASLANIAMLLSPRDRSGRANPIALFLVMLIAPLAASLIQLSISRTREYAADHGAGELSGDPEALASALQKIENVAKERSFQAVEAHPAIAQMMIMNPLTTGGLRSLFSTHPPTEERVSKLLQMSKTGIYPS